MFERPKTGQRALLVHLNLNASDYAEAHREFVMLVASADGEIVGEIGGSRRTPDPRYFVGGGKAEEIAAAAEAFDAQVVIMNHDLSPSQERNLEAKVKARVLDRAGLILDIFAQRARSHEGKLQVELAQLDHLATRLVRGWSHLERQKGGIGLRGPGETQLETDRRLLGHRIKTLRSRLDTVRARRDLGRAARRRNAAPTVSLVGYTNAGKSTLFNALTDGEVYAADQLFATLDPTLRQLTLPAGEPAVLADTVGFIRDLPHALVAAFRATLEETTEADLILHVIDAADPERAARIRDVELVLEEIGAADCPRLDVYNKVDLAPGFAPGPAFGADGLPRRVCVSARTGTGLDALRDVIALRLQPDMAELTVRLPPEAGRLRARLFAVGDVTDESTTDDGVIEMRLAIPHALFTRICRQEGLDPAGLQVGSSPAAD